jgi:20S proteasome alpha/beta subunit
MQGYTQHGNLRPFAVSVLYAAYDSKRGFQLFGSNPSGVYQRYKAHVVGSNWQKLCEILKSDFQDSCSIQEACLTALKALQSVKEKEHGIRMSTITGTEERDLQMHHLSEREVSSLTSSLSAQQPKDE